MADRAPTTSQVFYVGLSAWYIDSALACSTASRIRREKQFNSLIEAVDRQGGVVAHGARFPKVSRLAYVSPVRDCQRRTPPLLGCSS